MLTKREFLLTKREFLAAAAGAGAVSFLARPAVAQAYPNRTIKIIVPGSPGGPTDVMARLISQRLQPAIGQSVIIENRAGGGGSVAAKAVANAEPDGYTLLFCNTSIMTTIPAVAKQPEYDPVKNFAPVAKVSQAEQLLVLHPSVKANTVKEFVALCRAEPGKLNCAATGYGGLPHMVAEYFKAKAGADFAIIQYKGGGDSLTAVLGHQVDLTFETTTILLPHIRAGKLKGLAVTSETRNPIVPEIPTMIEAGVEGYVAPSFNGVVAPAGTPAAVLSALNAAINGVLQQPDVRAEIEKLGGQINVGSAQDFSAFIAREAARWREVADANNIKVE
jgi:tripartite-type tricarboxylate transporter receptor subunit TctC